MLKPAKNTSSGPVVIDDEGHTLGGGEWGQVDPDAQRVKDAVDAGLLVITDHGPDDAPAEPDDKPRSRRTTEEKS